MKRGFSVVSGHIPFYIIHVHSLYSWNHWMRVWGNVTLLLQWQPILLVAKRRHSSA